MFRMVRGEHLRSVLSSTFKAFTHSFRVLDPLRWTAFVGKISLLASLLLRRWHGRAWGTRGFVQE